VTTEILAHYNAMVLAEKEVCPACGQPTVRNLYGKPLTCLVCYNHGIKAAPRSRLSIRKETINALQEIVNKGGTAHAMLIDLHQNDYELVRSKTL